MKLPLGKLTIVALVCLFLWLCFTIIYWNLPGHMSPKEVWRLETVEAGNKCVSSGGQFVIESNFDKGYYCFTGK